MTSPSRDEVCSLIEGDVAWILLFPRSRVNFGKGDVEGDVASGS